MSFDEKMRELLEGRSQLDEQSNVEQPQSNTPRLGPGLGRPGPWWSRLLAAAVAVAGLVALVAVLLAIAVAMRGRGIVRSLRLLAGADDGTG